MIMICRVLLIAVMAALALRAQPTLEQPLETKGQDARVQVRIIEAGFHDALYFTPAEWVKMTESTVDKLKAKRFQDWKDFVEAQSKIVPIEPTKEELEEEKLLLEERLAIVNDALDVLNEKP